MLLTSPTTHRRALQTCFAASDASADAVLRPKAELRVCKLASPSRASIYFSDVRSCCCPLPSPPFQGSRWRGGPQGRQMPLTPAPRASRCLWTRRPRATHATCCPPSTRCGGLPRCCRR